MYRELVGIIQGDAQLIDDMQHLPHRNAVAGRTPFQEGAQRVSLHVFHGNEDALAGGADVVHAHDVRVRQSPGDARLVEKAVDNHLFRHILGQQGLQGEIFSQHIVVHLVDASHTAAADHVQHGVPVVDHLTAFELKRVLSLRRGRRRDRRRRFGLLLEGNARKRRAALLAPRGSRLIEE